MFSKIIHTYWTRALATALVFISVALTSRELGAAGKGITSIFTTDVLFICLFNDLVGGASLIYLASRYRLASLLLPSALFSLFNSLVFTTLFHAAGLVESGLALHLYGVAVSQSLNNLLLYVLLGKENISRHNYLFLLKSLINTALLAFFFLILEEKTVQAFIKALYIANWLPIIVSFPWLFAALRENFPKGSFWQTTREIVSYSGLAQFANIIQTLNYRLCFYLLAWWMGDSEVGFYSIALALSDVIWMLSKSIGTVQGARIANSNDETGARELTQKFSRYSILSTAAVLLPALLMPRSFYEFVFGSGFDVVKEIILMMAFGIIVFSVNIILSNYFSGTGRFLVNVKASLIGLAVSATANALLIPRMGIAGAGIAATATYITITLYTGWMFWRDAPSGWKSALPGKAELKRALMLIGWARNTD